MYELELAFMVIAHSQRDPGEYMLQLQQFASQPEGPLRRHALDMHLGRWRHALSHLLCTGPGHFEQALALASDKVSPSSSLQRPAAAQRSAAPELPGCLLIPCQEVADASARARGWTPAFTHMWKCWYFSCFKEDPTDFSGLLKMSCKGLPGVQSALCAGPAAGAAERAWRAGCQEGAGAGGVRRAAGREEFGGGLGGCLPGGRRAGALPAAVQAGGPVADGSLPGR